MEIAGRIAVITGAGSGIGRAMAQRFAAEGARKVVCVDRVDDSVAEVAQGIGDVATARTLDVTDEAGVAELIAEVERDFGTIDLLCSNAGIAVRGDIETDNDSWEQSWQVNVMAHLYAARAALPRMLERGEGYLVNTASAAGLLTQIGSASYAVTKHAAVGLAEFLAINYADRGIGVSVLCPQAVRTAMTADTENGGVAGVDGMIEPEQAAEAVVDAVREERFLILTHPEVLTYMQRKTADYDRWIKGMRRLRERFIED